MRNVLKTGSYMAAPKATFAARNPRKFTMAKAGQWAMNRVRPRPRRPSMGSLALKGLGAAAVALPVGMWISRRMRDEDRIEH